MKKINITQLEKEQLSKQEQRQVQGGYYWCLCADFENNPASVASVGAATEPPYFPPPPPDRPKGPGDCLCLIETDPWGYGGDSGSAYAN